MVGSLGHFVPGRSARGGQTVRGLGGPLDRPGRSPGGRPGPRPGGSGASPLFFAGAHAVPRGSVRSPSRRTAGRAGPDGAVCAPYGSVRGRRRRGAAGGRCRRPPRGARALWSGDVSRLRGVPRFSRISLSAASVSSGPPVPGAPTASSDGTASPGPARRTGRGRECGGRRGGGGGGTGPGVEAQVRHRSTLGGRDRATAATAPVRARSPPGRRTGPRPVPRRRPRAVPRLPMGGGTRRRALRRAHPPARPGSPRHVTTAPGGPLCR